MCAAESRLTLGRHHRCGCFSFSLLLSQQLGLSDQRGLVACAWRPASASLHHRGAVWARGLQGGQSTVSSTSLQLILIS